MKILSSLSAKAVTEAPNDLAKGVRQRHVALGVLPGPIHTDITDKGVYVECMVKGVGHQILIPREELYALCQAHDSNFIPKGQTQPPAKAASGHTQPPAQGSVT
jgi:hypothetical protein